MSIRHLSAIWEDGYYTQGDKAKLLVALAIADSARSEDGEAWPGIEYLARKARTSVRGVQEACRELEKDGRLKVQLNAGINGTNRYTVLLLVPPQPLHPPRNEAPEIPPEEAPADCTQTVRNRQEREGTENPPAVAGVPEVSIHKKFIHDWCERYEHRNGCKYPFGPRDARAAKQLLTHFKTLKETKIFIKACQERSPEGYPFVGTETLYDLANGIARLQAALAQPPKPQGSRGRPEPAPKPRIQLV